MHAKPLVVDVVAVFLPEKDGVDGVRRTFEELWAVATGGGARQLELASVPRRAPSGGPAPRRHPHPRHPAGHHRPGRGLGPGRRGPGHRDPRPHSASAEILAAAAHFPEWMQAMEGVNVPFVYLGGYVVTHPANEAWRHVPCLSWNEFLGRVNLMDHWADHHQRRWAVPTRRQA